MLDIRPWTVPKLLSLLDRELREMQADPDFAPIFRYYREPQIDRDAEQYCAWVTMKRFGLEFGFVDRPYREGADSSAWGEGPLVLNQIYFYRQDERRGNQSWCGALPMAIDFDDDRAQVRRKLAAWEHRRRSHLTDCWTLENHQLVVAHRDGDAGVACVMCSLDDLPWVIRPAAVPLPSCREMLSCLGESSRSRTLRDVWRMPEIVPLLAAVRPSTDEIDLRRPYGLELRFVPTSRRDPTAVNAKDMCLSAIHLYRERMHDALAWSGDLPFGLNWDDSPEALFRKVDAPALHQRDDAYTGTAVWALSEFTLTVSYSNTHNVLSRLIVQLASEPA